MDFNEFIEKLKAANDINDVVSSYITLKRKGSTSVGLCPFHSEKTPSFTVFNNTQSYFCFGCSSGGDVITFIRQIENLDYIDAVKLLADRAGMSMPQSTDYDDTISKKRAVIFDINKHAARFYHDSLMNEKNKRGLEYFKKRKFTEKTIYKFGLGYAPDGWDNLLRHLRSLGYKDEDLAISGLFARSKKGGLYDVFRDRVMIPIIDLSGKVIAFGGRVLGDGTPKYLNSPDTLVFKKSNQLFSLNNAKNTKTNELILAEGYMDVISLAQAGFENTVATLGTAITRPQARLMSHYASKVIIAYDSDSAGQRATEKAMEYLSETGVDVRVLKITGGKDPDEYIRTYGADKFRLLLSGSSNYIDFKLSNLLSQYDLELFDDKINYTKRAAVIIADIINRVERDVFISKLAKETGIAKDAIEIEVERIIKNKTKKILKEQNKVNMRAIKQIKDEINPERAKNIKSARAEERLICILFKNPDKFKLISSNISGDDFTTQFNKKIFIEIKNQLEGMSRINFSEFNAKFTPEQIGRIKKIELMNTNGSEKEIFDYINIIKQEKVNNKYKLSGTKEDLNEYLNLLRKKKKK